MMDVSTAEFLCQFVNGGYLELRAIHHRDKDAPKPQRFLSVDRLAEVNEFATQYGADHDLFFGVAERATIKNGTLSNCSETFAVWADIDFKHTSEEGARSQLSIFPLQPSIQVHSGGGLHLYWLLNAAYELRDNPTAVRFKSLLRRLAHVLKADLTAAEPARVLRIPGTTNHKYPRPVLVEYFDSESRFDIADFEFLPEVEDHAKDRERQEQNDGQLTSDKERFAVMRRYREYLAGADEDVRQHEKRDPVTFRLAAVGCKDFGLAVDDVFAVMWDWNQFRCKPPWTEAELRQKINNANKYGKHPLGEMRDKPLGGAELEQEVEFEATSYIEFSPTFLAVEDPLIEYIIPELIPRGVICLDHGDPRTMKSLAAVEKAVAAATGTPAFGIERFRPLRPFRVLYSSQEDPARMIRPRVKGILLAHGITTFPETLAFAVHKNIDLENPEWQERLIFDVKQLNFDLVILDPIRRYSPNADKGPAEVGRITAFLRRLVVASGATVDIVHHDTKPPSQGPDTRRRSHRASGGDWFAASECPVSFEKIGEGRSLVIPEDFKFSGDPQSFAIRYSEGKDADGNTVIRLIGEDATAEQARTLAVDEKVITYIAEHRGSSGNAIAKGIRVRREDVTDALARLTKSNKIDSIKAGKKERWFLKNESQDE
jgi:hypothetical protein